MGKFQRLIILCALASCALGLTTGSASADARGDCAGVDAGYTASTLAALRASVICLVNRERVARGMLPLNEEAHLDAAAQAHSEDMAANNYFDHTDLGGGAPWDRTKAAGYASGWIGENIAAGYGTPYLVMTGWMKSEGHCANILTSHYVDIGIGVIKAPGSSYGTYWTMELGGNGASSPKVTVTCPYAGLIDGVVPVAGPKAPAASAAKPRVTMVKRSGDGRYRIKGVVTPAAKGARVELTVKRGKKSRTYAVRTGASGEFSKTVRPPSGTGKVRVSARLSG